MEELRDFERSWARRERETERETNGSEAGQFQAVDERTWRLTKRNEDLANAGSRREGWRSAKLGRQTRTVGDGKATRGGSK